MHYHGQDTQYRDDIPRQSPSDPPSTPCMSQILAPTKVPDYILTVTLNCDSNYCPLRYTALSTGTVSGIVTEGAAQDFEQDFPTLVSYCDSCVPC